MLNATVELFMSEYFLIKAVLGKHLENSEKLFMALCKIFLIPENDAGELYRLSENPTARAITTDKDFLQHQRMIKYSHLIGTADECNPEWEEIAKIKGSTILFAQSKKLFPNADASRNMIYTCLVSAATCGKVSALRITGILQCEGIFFGKNERLGIKTLSKAADWNDTVSTLALLRYCKDMRGFNMTRLKQEVTDTPFEELYEIAAKEYGGAYTGQIEEVKLLNKAFNSGALKREMYDPKYVRILNSTALYIKDKEKVVFAQSRELASVIADLPLKLTNVKTAPVDVKAISNTAINREREVSAVVRALNNADLRHLPSYRPLCLCCNSIYILETYARALNAKSVDTHVEVMDVAELSEYDFDLTPSNIFVRSIDEDKDNRFLLFFCGDVSESKTDAVKSILQSERRAKFHLNNPSVTLNLSAVLPVCFCDESNARVLKPYCDVIQLAEITEGEMSVAVNNVIAIKEKLYGVSAIKLDGDVAEIFKGYDIDTAEKLIDEAVRARREKGAVITLTREILEEYGAANVRQTIGFGGNNNGRY
ncbi:MAG: hypothetical protein K2L12_01345 [Clostridia bacterium]|nr:hypothetical protein [Clostridia bacterium]